MYSLLLYCNAELYIKCIQLMKQVTYDVDSKWKQKERNSLGRRYGPSIGRIAIATQGQIEVDGKKPAVAAIVVGSEGSQRPLTAFELVLNRKDDVSRGHGSQQQQQIRGVSESDPHHYHLCNCMQPLFLPSLLPTGERIERQKK